jgi:glycosyltransferase involved in cell wall biosynthesis
MGGAEKRFAETLKILSRKNSLKITILESAPSVLDSKINCQKILLPSRFYAKGWIGNYVSWILWMFEASARSFSIGQAARPHVIFVPNNTLPNLISGCVTSFTLQKPLCVITHHLDTPFIDGAKLKDRSLYSCYRNIRYGRLVSLAKTLSFYMSIPFLKKASRIIAVSNFTAETLVNSGVPEKRIIVSGNAVDADSISRVKLYFRTKMFDGVFVGRLSKEKGVFDLLKVWRNIVKARKNARLLIIGSGLEFNLVRERIALYGLENKVLLRKRCSDKELYGLLKSSEVFIFPSLFEGWGIAVAEALACGLPVVAYDIPALREIFGKCKSMFLVPVKNLENMTSIILDILNAKENEKHELRNYSKSFSRQFVWKRVAEKDMALLLSF